MRLIFFTGLFLVSSIWLTVYEEAIPQAKTVTFKKHILTSDFLSEGVAVGDVNRDGKKDILAGAYWFEAPDWTPHALDTPKTFSPADNYSNAFLNFATDVNGDGWIDLIRIDTPGEGVYWYENPQGKAQYWSSHLIHPTVCNELPALTDMDGDGFMDLLFSDADKGRMTWFRNSGNGAWKAFPISETGAPVRKNIRTDWE